MFSHTQINIFHLGCNILKLFNRKSLVHNHLGCVANMAFILLFLIFLCTTEMFHTVILFK